MKGGLLFVQQNDSEREKNMNLAAIGVKDFNAEIQKGKPLQDALKESMVGASNGAKQLALSADAAKEENNTIKELYNTYLEADNAYANNIGSKEDLTKATDSSQNKCRQFRCLTF